jgi:hypothetical protein
MNYRRIVVAAPAARHLRWHVWLRDRLAARLPQADVVFRFEPRPDDQSGTVTQLLALEKMLLRRGRPTLCDRIDPDPARAALDGDADVLIDLTGVASPASAPLVLRPLYDEQETDQAAIAAILADEIPEIGVEDAATGAVLTRGLPSFEAADGLTGALEALYSRMATLIEKAVTAPDPGATPSRRPAARPPRHPAAFFGRNIAFLGVRWIYKLVCHSPHWRVGWRYVDGPGAIDAVSLGGAPWRTLPDEPNRFAADPFPIVWRGQTGVFYEALDYADNIGRIYYQALDAGGPTGPALPVLGEPWHLSYPFLIEEDGVLYMIPEASLSGAVTLYRCVDFPGKWEPVAHLLEGVEAADATVFRHGGRYWMTSVIREGYGGYSDTLALHHAPALFGPWEPHRLSPVLVDARFARPAGAVAATGGGALLRPVQDCLRGYGKGLAIMRIDQLDPEHFSQSLVGRLSTSGNAVDRLHTLNRWGRLEVIDHAVLTPKFMPLRRALHARMDAANG